MQDAKDRQTLLADQPSEHGAELEAGSRIQVAERFIEQQEAGLLRQGARQGDALLLATRKFLGPSGGPLGGADPAQGLVRAAAGATPSSSRPNAAFSRTLR